MKQTFVALCLLLASGAAASTPYHLNREVTAVNAVTRRTEIIFHPTREEALTRPFEQSAYYRSLNGTWRFRYADSEAQLPARIEATTPAEAAAWSEISVPGNWEVQGFGIPIYVNQGYEFCPVNPQPPQLPAANPVGVYQRTFEVPQNWEGQPLYLTLCGAKSGVYVYLNGCEAGYAEDSKDAVRYDLTPYLCKGENNLIIKIYRFSTGSYLESMDFWRISGLERDVYLSTEPRKAAFDFAVVPTLDSDYRTGLFTLRACSDQAMEFAYELLAPTGETLLSGSQAGADKVRFEGKIPDVKAWSAEHPNLYTLLMQVNGAWTRFRVGFRRIEIGDYDTCDASGRPYRVLRVNGQPVKFKGVNLHEHNPWTGHYVTREMILQDLALMRRHNINAIRTCHYPQQRLFYELCDSLGFYVYDEANVESHGMGYDLTRTLGNDRRWYNVHIDRILNMYYRTRNYASVTILSLGNEGGNGYNFYRAYEALEALEAENLGRPVCYERAEYEWNTDMLVPQYPGADWFRRKGEEGSDRPVCPSEYAHAMGNSTGSLDLQWSYIYKYPNLQGGFIWDWVDQGLAAQRDGRDFWGYGGDYGERTPSQNNFLCNGLVNPDRLPHPALAEVSHVYQNIKIEATEQAGRYTIENRHYFTTLDGYEVTWQLMADGRCVKSGTRRFSTAPQQRESFDITLPALNPALDYTLDFAVKTLHEGLLLPAGSVVATDQILLQKGARPHYAAKAKAPAKIVEEAEHVTLQSAATTLRIDTRTGVVTSIQVGGKELLYGSEGLHPNFWRGPNDNDYGNGQPRRAQIWKTSSRDFRATVTTAMEGSSAVATVAYELAAGNPCTVTYRLHDTGLIDVEMQLTGIESERPTDIPRVGMLLHLAKDNDGFTYYGRGPGENYRDRFTGTPLGRYTTSTQAQYYPYVRPQECGHHTDCQWITIGGATFVADGTMEFTALRNTIWDFDSEEATTRDYQWLNFTPDEHHDPAEAKDNFRRQTHIDDITARDFVELTLDAAATGVGGYDSWGSRPEQERTLWSNHSYGFRFTLVPEALVPAKRATQYRYK